MHDANGIETWHSRMNLFRREAPRQTLDFEQVVLAELPVLYRVAKHITGDPSVAEDLVAQTLLDAGRGWPGFDGRYPRSWLIMILKNNYKKGLRHSAARPQVEPLTEDRFCIKRDLVEDLNMKAVGVRLMEEVNKLPEEFKMAVVLCDIEEMSYQEAAHAVGVPTGTIRSRLYRGRRLLRRKLAGLVEDVEEPRSMEGY